MRWSCRQVLDSQTLDQPCNLSETQQWISSSCTLQMNNRRCLCSLFISDVSLRLSVPLWALQPLPSVKRPLRRLHLWNVWEISFPAATSSPLMWSTTWDKPPPFLDGWNRLFQNLNIKTAVYKALLNGCKEKPTRSLYIKPLQAFHARCLRGILEIRCKSILGNGTNWTASAIQAKPCHIDTRTTQSYMASCAIVTGW